MSGVASLLTTVPLPVPLKLSAKVAAAVPVPESETTFPAPLGDCEGASVFTVIVPVCAPTEVGEKLKESAQAALGAIVPLQAEMFGELNMELPLRTTELTVRLTVPLVLEIMMLCDGLVVEVWIEPNAKLVGATDTAAELAGAFSAKSAVTVKPGLAIVILQGDTEQPAPLKD